MNAYTIRELEPGDARSALAAWNRVFASAPGSVARGPQDWSWAFEANPAGRRVFVAVHSGDVVAQYAALPVRMLVEGQERTFAQIVDSLVVPEHRAGLKRPGLFVEVGRAFFDACAGEEKSVVFYGWPVESAWRIGERFLGYRLLRAQLVLVREPGDGPSALPEGVVLIERFDQEARGLYDRCCGSWGASAIRDDRYLNWRYVDRPGHAYVRLGVRDGEGILRGLVVLRTLDFLLPRTCVIADWLVPANELDVALLLFEAVLAHARAAGANAICAVQPEWSSWFPWFQERGCRVHPTDYSLLARSFHPRFDLDWLRERWWYQLGDSDLI
jgi:hypothetical protein